jgi:hypothetical protein
VTGVPSWCPRRHCKLERVRKKTTGSEREPRWPVLVALLAVAGMYLALPEYLTVGPYWFLPAAVGALAAPTVLFHRMGRHRLDRILGFLINSVITTGLIAAVVLLLTRVPARKEAPGDLLRAAGALWVTNVLVFALWYWRLDAGGPHRRDSQTRHTEGAFFFPQMIEGAPVNQAAPWSPRFIDYLFIAFNTSAAFSPTDTPVLDRWAKVLSMLQAVISLLVVVILGSRAVGLL